MSMNNVLPAWVVILSSKEDLLSNADFIEWLYSEEAMSIIPESVRYNKIMDAEMKEWDL